MSPNAHAWSPAGTILFGLLLLCLKSRSSFGVFPPLLLAGLFGLRIAFGFLTVFLYLRGGVALVSWWSLLIEAKHLLELG